jgi:hypothetical protein
MDNADGFDARLSALLEKRGQDLVRGLIEELHELRREVAALKRELSALSDYQSSRDRLLAIERVSESIAPLPRNAVIESDQLLRAEDGFYPVEQTSDGTPFRWTGPSREFSFDVFVDRTYGAEIRLAALNCMDFEIQKNVALLVDGEPVSQTMEPEGSGFTLTAFLSPRKGSQATDLVYVLPAVIVPTGSEDKRPLGIAFARLTATARMVDTGAEISAQNDAFADEDLDDLDLGDASAFG